MVKKKGKTLNWDESKVQKALGNILEYVDAQFRYSVEEIIQMPEINIMDSSNCVMVSARTERAKLAMSQFLNKELDFQRFPKLDYHNAGFSKISLEFLKAAVNLFATVDDSVRLITTEDYPLRMESLDFIVIIAPRVEKD